MARISGVDIPNAKRVEIGLTYIYGIGRARSNEILKKTGINPDVRVKDLTEDDVAKLREVIENNSTATAASATERACLSEDSGPKPTRAREKARSRPSPIRRNKGGKLGWQRCRKKS